MFDPVDGSVGAARRFVTGLIQDVPADVQDSVALMVSELSTNALVHAGGGFDLVVDRTEDSVFVSVSDRGDGTPALQSPESTEPHGRGLRIVDALSDEWGTSAPSDRGKTVWFRISLRSPGTGRSGDRSAGSEMAGPEAPDQQPAGRPAETSTRSGGGRSQTLSSRHHGPRRRSRSDSEETAEARRDRSTI